MALINLRNALMCEKRIVPPSNFMYAGLLFDKPHYMEGLWRAFAEVGNLILATNGAFWTELNSAYYIGWGMTTSENGDAGKWRCGGNSEAPHRVVQNVSSRFSCIQDVSGGYGEGYWTRPMFFPYRLNNSVSAQKVSSSTWTQYGSRYSSLPIRKITSASIWLSYDLSTWYQYGAWAGNAPNVNYGKLVDSAPLVFTGDTNAFSSYIDPSRI